MKFEKMTSFRSILPDSFPFTQIKMLLILGISPFRILLFNPDGCLAELYCLFFFHIICIFGVTSRFICDVLPRKNI